MNATEVERYRQRLLTLGNRIKGDFTHLQGEALRSSGGEASGNLSNAPMHPADLGTDNFEAELSLGLLANEEQHLEDIAAALDRIREGRFGICENCQREIGRERLDALPYVRYCIDCARRLEEPQSQLNGL